LSYSSIVASRPVFLTFVAAIAFSVAMPLRSEQMPRINGENLSGEQISLPSASAGSVAIICLGFSHASQSQLKPWADRAAKAFPQNDPVVVYLVAVLQDAPRLVRGMAVHAMKTRVPAQQRERFLVVYQGESELKRITRFQQANEAYILVLDGNGEVHWVTHGPATEGAFEELANRVHSIER
jgi:hypothetical protein